MRKQKTFDVYCEVYGVNLFVVLGGSSDDLNALMKRRFKISPEKKYGDEPVSRHLGGCLMEFDKWPYQVLWLGSKCVSKKDLIPKIAHEVFHMVLRVASNKNFPTYPKIDNLIMDEPAAYLMEFYMREILKKLNK